jgi:hypothetical protein
MKLHITEAFNYFLATLAFLGMWLIGTFGIAMLVRLMMQPPKGTWIAAALIALPLGVHSFRMTLRGRHEGDKPSPWL